MACCGSDARTAVCELEISADQVSYDNSLNLYPPGTDNVQEALEAAAGGGGAVLATPVVFGSVFGLTREPPDIDEVTSLGYESLTTYATQSPDLSVSSTTVCGSFNLTDLSQGTTACTQNFIGGNSILNAVGPLTTLAGNVVLGHAVGNTQLQELTDCNLIGTGGVTFADLFNGRDLARQITCISTAQNTFSANDLVAGIVILGNTSAFDANDQSVTIGAGNTAQLNGVSGILISQGTVAYDNAGWTGTCALLGANAAAPDLQNQCVIGHDMIRMPNALTTTPATGTSQPLVWDSSTKRIQPAVTSGASTFRRVWSASRTTDASGNVTFNYAALALGANPHVVATAQNGSATTFHGARVTSVSPSSATIKVFQSVLAAVGSATMVASGAGVVVDCIVSY